MMDTDKLCARLNRRLDRYRRECDRPNVPPGCGPDWRDLVDSLADCKLVGNDEDEEGFALYYVINGVPVVYVECDDMVFPVTTSTVMPGEVRHAYARHGLL